MRKEISAAKVCHEILLKYAKDKIQEDLASTNEKTKVATALMAMPPEKYILTVCSEFFHLHYLLKGLYENYTDEQLAAIMAMTMQKFGLIFSPKGIILSKQRTTLMPIVIILMKH